jgi:predicted nucleic acid-binding protein
MLLVDTTVWIDFFAGRPAPWVDYLEKIILQKEDVCLCGVVLTEILQGISTEKHYKQVLTTMNSLVFLPMEYDVFVAAADIYRYLRAKGITVRKTIDCLIAAVALENDVSLLHCDRDFDPIEKYCHLKTIKV